MATPDVKVSSPIDDSLNSIHNNPHYKFLLELCQTNRVDLSEQDFEYFFKPISLEEMAEMAEMQITRDILEWIGYKGSVKEKLQSFERELIKNNYTYTSNPISEDIPPKNTVLMIVPKMVYRNVILQLSTPKAAQIRQILIQAFYNLQNFKTKAASVSSEHIKSLKTTSVPAASENDSLLQAPKGRRFSDTPEVNRRKLSNTCSGNSIDERDKSKSIPYFSMYYHNVGGLNNKLQDFKNKADDVDCSYDAIALTGTKLKDDKPNNNNNNNNNKNNDNNKQNSKYFDSTKFNFYTKNLSSEETRGGGVLFAIKSDYASEEIKLADVSGETDQLCVRVEIPILPSSKIINVFFFVSYIRQRSKKEVYDKHVKNITDIVNENKDENCYFVVCGDFNLSDIVWKKKKNENSMEPDRNECKVKGNAFPLQTVANIMSLKMNQKNDIPNSSKNILDLIFVDSRLSADLKKASIKLLTDGPFHESLEIEFSNLSVLNKSKSLCNNAPKFDSENADHSVTNIEMGD